MLMSMPSKPSLAQWAANCSILPGSPPQIWATSGCSSSFLTSRPAMALSPACTQPVALANSVKNTSGAPACLTTWRKTTSVTASIGAKAKNGCGRLSQNDVIPVILSQKGKPLTGVIDSEGRRAQAVLLRIVLCVEDNFSTSETREPKSWCPATSSKRGESRGRGAEGERNGRGSLPPPPLMEELYRRLPGR